MAKDDKGHGSEKRGGRSKVKAALRGARVAAATSRSVKGLKGHTYPYNKAGISAVRQIRSATVDRKVSGLKKQISALKSSRY